MHKKIVTLLIMFTLYGGLVASAISHTYFFGVSDLTLNTKTNKLEIVHQFTTHDIENAIAQTRQINFSTEHENYELFIQQYFEQHFSIIKDNVKINLNWLGFEVTSGKIIAYQESAQEYFLTQLVVKNAILTDTYPKQVNTVNFQGNDNQGKAIFGSLTFDYRVSELMILTKKNK
jgi:ABC-type microcin C transport system permease subunit YejE